MTTYQVDGIYCCRCGEELPAVDVHVDGGYSAPTRTDPGDSPDVDFEALTTCPECYEVFDMGERRALDKIIEELALDQHRNALESKYDGPED